MAESAGVLRQWQIFAGKGSMLWFWRWGHLVHWWYSLVLGFLLDGRAVVFAQGGAVIRA